MEETLQTTETYFQEKPHIQQLGFPDLLGILRNISPSPSSETKRGYSLFGIRKSQPRDDPATYQAQQLLMMDFYLHIFLK